LGEVELIDCVSESASCWFDGPTSANGKRNFGLVLRHARALLFRPLPGRLGLFEALYDLGTPAVPRTISSEEHNGVKP
jgi:hypothetical protein